MAKLSEHAVEMNEAMDPGSMSPARCWARDLMDWMQLRASKRKSWYGFNREVLITHNVRGDIFAVECFFLGCAGPAGPKGEFRYRINGSSCDARAFELGLADRW